jgi:acyl carrier protein
MEFRASSWHTGPTLEGDMDLLTRIRKFVISNFYLADEAALSNDKSLLIQGIVDSTGVMEIIAFVEAEFGIRVLDEELLPENLDSISKIAGYVTRKQSQP